ncbi:hypothetical protein FRC07_011546 [Ceratobasidium sp. 392]|nr:hypothetical protein FRC07_011546 [Ceratobasidium sp. 392]
MINNSPHYEDSWNGDILTLLTFVFPAAALACFIWKPQYNMRLPVPAGRTTSTDSNNQAVRGQSEPGAEPGLLKPDFVVAQGHRGSQRIVAIIEIKRGKNVGKEDASRFLDYCTRVVECYPEVTGRTTALLIAGGIPYQWTRVELNQLLQRGPLKSSRLKAMRDVNQSVRVDTDEFLTLLQGICDRFDAV